MKPITPATLLESYDGLLIDAYGVLVTSSGPVPGATRFVAELEDSGLPWSIVTNDASRLPETAAREYGALIGIAIDPARVVTAGSMLRRWVESNGLVAESACVLGTPDSRTYAERAGLELVEADEARIFVFGDDSGFDFIPSMNAVLTAVIRRIDRGEAFELVCPNADFIYPKGEGGFGLAAGAMATMLTSGLEARFPERSFVFEHLGKPNPEMFYEGVARLGPDFAGEVVVLGDTPATDVAGANAAGFDVVLFGDASVDPNKKAETPTWRLRSW